MRYFGPLVLSLASVCAAQSSEDIWMCDAEMIVRIHPDDDGQFRVSEQVICCGVVCSLSRKEATVSFRKIGHRYVRIEGLNP